MPQFAPTEYDPNLPAGWAYRPESPIVGPLDYVLPLPVTVPDGQMPPSLHMLFTYDGTYLPAVIRTPPGLGPFPVVVCLHSGSGGLGIRYMVDAVVNRGSLLDRLVEEGYAICWTEGRREIPDAYGTDIPAVLDHQDILNAYRYVCRLPFVDEARVCFFGTSHGGELQLKVISELGAGPAALIPVEPAVHEFLGLRHEGPFDAEHLQYQELLRDDQIDLDRALERIEQISPEVPILVVGRDGDHFQGLFRKLYELLERCGKNVEWVSFEHELHAFHWGPVREQRTVAYWGKDSGAIEVESGYAIEDLHREVMDMVVSFLDRHTSTGTR